ncbi:MAG TPA: RsbRD N-terminal domain-containing protein [Actinocrinis sp.]|nr:RsbRD N-terminal domain-containing protein [Actinocrinis sp.]
MPDQSVADQLVAILSENPGTLADGWVAAVSATLGGRVSRTEVDRELRELYSALTAGVGRGDLDAHGEAFAEARALLTELSRTRARQGFSPTETAIKTVVAARLTGAVCTISGIRPQIAQTIVALGINFGDITTKATLADALRHALNCSGVQVGVRAGRRR